MKYFGKYPVFFVLTALLCLAFAGGAAYDVYYAGKRDDAARRLAGKMKEYRKALAGDPTQATLDKAKANIELLQKHLDFLQKDLTRSSGDIFKGKPGEEGYELVEKLRGMVDNWRRTAADLGIIVASEMDFGFKKYVAAKATPPKKESILPIWRQACVLNYVNQKLFKCKTEKSPMYILSVQRELLPSEIEKEQTAKKKRGRTLRRKESDSTSGDNFKIDPAITARKEGSLDTIAYRFVFAGHTDVLRRFLNQLKDFDAMLVVRSIGVRPILPDELPMPEGEDAGESQRQSVSGDGTSADSIFSNASAPESQNQNGEASPAPETPQQDAGDKEGAQDGAAAPSNGGEASSAPAVSEQEREPVVENNLSEFTVVVEFVELTKDAPKAAAPADGGVKTDENDAKQQDTK